ncbi:MAG: ABC transporter ATP-binding protein [Bacteroidia bacterium]
MSNLFKASGSSDEDFWALQDVSFNVMPGETIGIVGKNGAGKSTLLKILSKITPPSSGKIISRGRIASLLEVGTGFHPELSGRENVMLNGSILGMKRKEILLRFDEIVAFAGVEQFIDTPLKHYSSGMQLRLAFAVAAFLEPEILVIDEVLAVGDAEFQKKCMGKMKDVSESGRTVLFVSHNMTAVSSLCRKSVFLQKGKVREFGDTSAIIDLYLKGDGQLSTFKDWKNDPSKNKDGVVSLLSVGLMNKKSEPLSFAAIDEECSVELNYKIEKNGFKPVPNVHISSAKGEKVLVTVEPNRHLEVSAGEYKSIFTIPANFFNEGTYVIGVAVSTLNPVIVHAEDYEAFYFDVVDNLDAVTRNEYTGKFEGVVRPLFNWETKKIK